MATSTDVTRAQSIGAGSVARTVPRGRRAPIVAILLAAVAMSAVLVSVGPGAEELEHARWQAMVDHYRGLYQATADAASSEAAYWQQVVDYHEAQWIQR